MKEEDRKNLIEKLRDDEVYYNGEGRALLSVSHIDMMMRTPELYIDFINGQYTPEHKTVFTIGQALHTIVLEGTDCFDDKFTVVDASTRNTNIYRDAPGGNNRLLLSEYNGIEKMVNRLSILSDYDEDVADLLSEFSGPSEEPNVIEVDGIRWKMKADRLTDSNVLDLKSTSDINGFKYSAIKYNNDAQAALYEKTFGVPFKFIIIDKGTLEVAIADCSDSFIAGGWSKIEEATQFYKEFIVPSLNGEHVNFGAFRKHITL